MKRFMKSLETPALGITHPLDGAIARLDRTDRHFDELKASIQRLDQANHSQLIAAHYEHAKALKIPAGIRRGFLSTQRPVVIPPPLEMAAIVSDIIHNLRAALDYLVFELALYDSRAEQNGTQFPIEEVKCRVSPKGKIIGGFDTRRDTFLRGVSDPHVSAIETLQPYSGVTWTETLRDISNPDKHRKIVTIDGGWAMHTTIEGGRPGSFKGRPGTVFPGIGKDGADIYAEFQYAIEVAFSDRSPVLKTLEILKSAVRDTIDSFKPEFKI